MHLGQIIAIANEGMPQHEAPSIKGTLFVHIIVKFPRELNSEQQALIRSAFGGGKDEL